MMEYKINSDLTVKLEQRTHYLQINFYVRGELINDYLSKLPKEEIRLIFVELLNHLIILGDLASKSKLKIEDRDELNAKIEVFFRFLDNPHITNFNNVLYENVLRHPKLDLITKYLVRIDKKKGDQLTSKLQKIALHRYPPDKWVKKLKRWIKEITINDLALALDRRFLDFLPETYFKALFIDNNFELVDKLIFIDRSRKYLGRIGNISPEIYSKYFEQCYMKSEFTKILTILNLGSAGELGPPHLRFNPYLKTESIKELVAYPHSKVIEIVAKSLKGALKRDAGLFISRHPWISSFLSNELKDFTEKEIYDTFYYLLEQDYLSGFRAYHTTQDIENLLELIDPKILKKLPTKIIDKFIEYLRKNNFEDKLDGWMFMFLNSFKKFSFTNQVFKTEINRLIELNQPIVLFRLWNMDLLDYYSLEEKINFFSKFEFPVLAEESLKFHGGESIALNLDKFVALGDYGPDFIIRLFINHEIDTEYLYDIFNSFIKDHFDMFKEGIINSFIKLEYPQIKDLFRLEAISKLSKEDIRKIIEPSPSRFYEKLNLAIEDNYSYAMLILKYVGKEGIPLFFKYISLYSYEQFGNLEIDIFKEYGNDVIEPFIQEVILNVHNYSYNYLGSETLSFLYDSFLDLFDDQQLKQLILKDDYKLIEMINKSNQRYYVLSSFFYLVYKRLDDETVLQIHNRFSDKYKQECIEYFVIHLIDYTYIDEKELGQYLRILSLVGNLFQAIDLAESIAEYPGFVPLSSELSNKLEVITIKNPQKLIKTLGDVLVFTLVGDDELSKSWFGVEFHASIKERLMGRILDELEDIYRNVVNGAYSNDDESWVNILVKFFEMVNNLGHLIVEGLTDYFKDYESVSDSGGNQINRAMDALIGAFPVVFENLVYKNEMAHRVLIKIGRGNNKKIYEFKEKE